MIDWNKYRKDLRVKLQELKEERKTKVAVSKTWVCNCGQTHVGIFYVDKKE